MIDNFYIRMSAMFGHTFTTQYGTEPSGVAGDTWAAVLAGLSGEQLARGLREVVKLGSDWPPSAPRFRMLCLDIPTLAAVRQEFKDKDGLHRSPFARKVWTFIDSYALSRADQRDADRIFRDAYDLAREHVMNGGELDPVPAAVLQTEKPAAPVPASEEVAKKHIAEILSTLNNPGSRPTVKQVIKQKDMAAGRTFLCVTLSDDRVIRPPAIETDLPTQAEIDAAIEKEIDRLMEADNAG